MTNLRETGKTFWQREICHVPVCVWEDNSGVSVKDAKGPCHKSWGVGLPISCLLLQVRIDPETTTVDRIDLGTIWP